MLPFRRLLPKDPSPLILLALPWLLLALNPNWPFGNAYNLDPWLYWTHARTYPAFQNAWPTYYGERLPMILPAYLFHHLFTPLIAQILVRITFFSLAVCSLYYIVQVVCDRSTAFLTAILFGCHSFFIAAVGWDYIDGYGITYYLLALAFLTRSWSAPRRQWWLLLTGVASAGCFYTNPIWALFLPFFPIYYVGCASIYRGQRGWFGMTAFLLLFLLGFCGVTACFALISHHAVGTYFFYKVSLSVLFNLNQHPEWTIRDFAWITHAAWLVFPVIVLLAGMAVVLRPIMIRKPTSVSHEPNPDAPAGSIASRLLLANFIYGCLALCYLTFIKNNRALEFPFYANVLLPSMFLALGTSLLVVPKSIGLVNFLNTLGVAGVVCLLPLWMRWRYADLPVTLSFLQPTSPFFKYYLVLPTVLGTAAVLLRVFRPQQVHIWQLAVLSWALVGFGLVPASIDAAWWAPYRGAALFARVAQASDLVCLQLGPQLSKLPFIWFDRTSPLAGDFYALASALMYGGGRCDTSLPALTVPAANYPLVGSMVILTETKEIPGSAESALHQIGLTGKFISQARVADTKVSYWITFLELSRGDATLAAQR